MAERVGFEPKVEVRKLLRNSLWLAPREKRPSKKLTDCFPDQRDSYA